MNSSGSKNVLQKLRFCEFRGVDRSNRRNEVAFSNKSGVMWALPHLLCSTLTFLVGVVIVFAFIKS